MSDSESTEAALAQQHLDLVVGLCRFIEESESPPALADLAVAAGRSTSHTRRVFQSVTGLSPKQYANSQLRKRMQCALEAGVPITEAIFGAGYGSTSRFYEKSGNVLGMTAGEFCSGANDLEIRFAVGACSLGGILVASTAIGVCAVLMGDDPDALIADLDRRFPNAILVGADAEYEQVAAQVIAAVETPGRSRSLPLDVRGTAFQQRVWLALSKIPMGATATYSQVAEAIGSPDSVRAVAGACAANAIAVLIPCHRVVRKDGGLSGYRWGVERKRELLRRESQNS